MVTENGQSDGNTSFLRAARNGQLDKVLEHLKSNIDINTSNANGLNALHLASKDGHVDIVEELLKRGAVVDAATKKGNTALHIASLAGQEEVVKLLVQHGASVNVQSQNGFTPLYMAAQENHDNVVKYLLSNGANQSLSTEDGFTPLAVAMQQGHDKVVTVLLENDTRGKVRLPALHIAAKKDDVKAAKLLLENEHNPDVTSKSGFTPLHIASHYGNQQIANLLIQKGADVNYAAKHNITPLHVAAKWGKTNMVATLLEHGATIEAKTRDGLTPLHCAARSGHEQVVDMLLERGAPISSKTKNGLAPLHMAAQGDHVDAARILLYHRAPVDEVTVDYLTALHVAAHCGHVRVAKLLLDRQADANARALNGFTPLHIACKKNRIKVVELLLKHGASIGATTESGLTPLHVASFMGCMNIVIYLLQHDANPDVPTIRGETPLHLAARANQTDIIRILLRNGAQVDARAREQQTPLHIASRLGNVDIVMLLLQHGAKVDSATKDMYTALHIAAKEGQDEVAGVLIDNGASINSTTKKGFTPLHLASKYGHLKVAKLLLQKEAPVDAQGKNGVTPLHVASHYDHQNVALLLLDKGASPHAAAKNGHTPLHIAARKNQMDIANTLLEYGALPNSESKAGFTPLHLSAQEGHPDMTSLLIEHKANTNHESKNGLAPLHLCAQEDRVPVAEILVKNGANTNAATKAGYTPLHIACHYGQANMVRFLLQNGANVESATSLGYTPLHQAAQQGHTNIVNILLEKGADPNAETTNGQTPLSIAQKLGYITVIETLKNVTTTPSSTNGEEKYRVQAPEAMQETFLSDSEEEGGEDTVLGDHTYRYLTADEMKSLGDDSLPIDVTRDERIDSNRMISSMDSNMLPPQHFEDTISPEHVANNYVEYIKKYTPDNVDIARHPISHGKLHWKNFLVSFLVDARGGAMRGCRHSGVRVIVPPRCAPSPTRITCRYVRPQRTPHPPPLMEGEALASRVLELGPVGAKFLGPVIIEVPHFAALRGKEREIVILRSDNGDSWKEHTVEAAEEILNDVLHDSFEAEDLNQLEDISSGRITRIITQDFPQYFAVVSRVRQEVHAIGPEGGMVSSTVVPQVQAIFPEGALTKKIKVGLQAQPIDPELTAKLLGHGVAVSPVVTVEPRRRKFHKAIRLNMPAPTAHSQGMINQYSGSAPTLRLLCSITGGTTRAQWEDVTGSTPLTFVNDVVSFTTTVSARFWLMDCRNIGDATKMATELYKEAIHVPFMAKFVVFAKRVDPLEARLRVFCMTDDKEDKTLEHQEHFTEVAKSRDVEVLEGKPQYIEFSGNLVPITKSGEQLQFSFRAFRENRLPFSVRVKDQHAEAVGRCLFMKEAKVQKGEPPQQPICILNIVLPDDIVTDTISLTDSDSVKRHMFLSESYDYYRPDPRLADMSNLLGDDWVELAHQLGLTSSEINVIKSEYPESTAKQAQSMLRMWLSQSGNKAQTNTLENALKRIGREDIIPQCLNVEQSHTVTRIKHEEIGYRLSSKETKKEKKEEPRIDKNRIEGFDKYSAEEKVVEKSESEEEDYDKTVPELREQIEKRLSAERAIPASAQRKEIVQEITTIKQQTLVEDKLEEIQQKETDVKLISPEKPLVSEPTVPKTTVKLTKPVESEINVEKTTTHKVSSSDETKDKTTHKTITTTTTTTTRTTTDHPGTDLLEGVTQHFEVAKKVGPKIIAEEDLKSPKFSKTPPPSPADFLFKDQHQATTVQGWDATGKPEIPKETTIETSPAQQGISTTTTQYLASNEDKSLDQRVVANFNPIIDQTNALIQFESRAEPYHPHTEKHYKIEKTLQDSSLSDSTKEEKKPKKGFFGTLKTFVSKSSTDHSDSDSEKVPKKERVKKEKRKKKKDTIVVEEAPTPPPRKPKHPSPTAEHEHYADIPYFESFPEEEERLSKPPLPPRTDKIKHKKEKPSPDAGLQVSPSRSPITSEVRIEANKIVNDIVSDSEKIVQKTPKETDKKSKVVVIEEQIIKTFTPAAIIEEEFTVVIDPTKKESPKKSRETFTLSIDESIEEKEKEILEKSPILSEAEIMKPIVPHITEEPPIRPQRLKPAAHFYEDIEEPAVQESNKLLIIQEWNEPLNGDIKKATTDLITNERSLSTDTVEHTPEMLHKDEVDAKEKITDSQKLKKKPKLFGIFSKHSKDTDESEDEISKSEIIEKQEKEESKEKIAKSKDSEENKKSIRAIFGKKPKTGKSTSGTPQLSEKVIMDMINTSEFLKEEVKKYEDKPMPLLTNASTELEIPVIPTKVKTEVKLEKSSLEKVTTDKLTNEPRISESVVKHMNDTTEFLNIELNRYDNGRFVPSQEITSSNAKEPKDLLNTDKVTISEEIKIKNIENIQEIKDIKQPSGKHEHQVTKPFLSDEVIKNMDQSHQFLADEVNNYHDVIYKIDKDIKPISDSSTKWYDQPLTTDNEEKKEKHKPKKESKGLFGMLKKKPDKSHEHTVVPVRSPEVVKELQDTDLFLKNEIVWHHDVYPVIKREEAEKQKSMSREASKERDIEKKDSKKIFGIFKRKSESTEEEPKAEAIQSSKEVSDSKAEIFSTKIEAKPEHTLPLKKLPEEVIQNMKDTHDFLEEEVNRYHDAKTIIKSDTLEQHNVEPKKESTKLFGIFKLKSDDSKDLEKTSEIPSESFLIDLQNTQDFLKQEVDTYHDVKWATQDRSRSLSPEKVVDLKKEKDHSPKRLFGIFKTKTSEDTTKSPIQKRKIILSEEVLQNITNSDNFLKQEIEKYHDVRPELNTDISKSLLEKTSAEEKPNISKSIKEESPKKKTEKSEHVDTKKDSKKLFGLFKKKTHSADNKDGENDLEEEIKLRQSSNDFLRNEVDIYHDVRPIIEKIVKEEPIVKKPDQPVVLSAEVAENIKNCDNFLGIEVEKYFDSKPVKSELKKVKIEKTIEESMDQKEKDTKEKIEPVTMELIHKEDIQQKPVAEPRKIKTETQKVLPPLSKEVVKHMIDTSNFIREEIAKYHDVRPIIKETESVLTEEKPGKTSKLFGLFSKKKSQDKEPSLDKELDKTDKETTKKHKKKAKEQIVHEVVKAEKIVLSEVTVKNMSDTENFLKCEVQRYEDAEKNKVTKVSPEVKEEVVQEKSGGFFGLFSKKTKLDKEKRKHDKTDEQEHSEKEHKQKVQLTNDFLTTEVDNHEDVKLIVPVPAKPLILPSLTEDKIIKEKQPDDKVLKDKLPKLDKNTLEIKELENESIIISKECIPHGEKQVTITKEIIVVNPATMKDDPSIDDALKIKIEEARKEALVADKSKPFTRENLIIETKVIEREIPVVMEKEVVTEKETTCVTTIIPKSKDSDAVQHTQEFSAAIDQKVKLESKDFLLTEQLHYEDSPLIKTNQNIPTEEANVEASQSKKSGLFGIFGKSKTHHDEDVVEEVKIKQEKLLKEEPKEKIFGKPKSKETKISDSETETKEDKQKKDLKKSGSPFRIFDKHSTSEDKPPIDQTNINESKEFAETKSPKSPEKSKKIKKEKRKSGGFLSFFSKEHSKDEAKELGAECYSDTSEFLTTEQKYYNDALPSQKNKTVQTPEEKELDREISIQKVSEKEHQQKVQFTNDFLKTEVDQHDDVKISVSSEKMPKLGENTFESKGPENEPQKEAKQSITVTTEPTPQGEKQVNVTKEIVTMISDDTNIDEDLKGKIDEARKVAQATDKPFLREIFTIETLISEQEKEVIKNETTADTKSQGDHQHTQEFSKPASQQVNVTTKDFLLSEQLNYEDSPLIKNIPNLRSEETNVNVKQEDSENKKLGLFGLFGKSKSHVGEDVMEEVTVKQEKQPKGEPKEKIFGKPKEKQILDSETKMKEEKQKSKKDYKKSGSPFRIFEKQQTSEDKPADDTNDDIVTKPAISPEKHEKTKKQEKKKKGGFLSMFSKEPTKEAKESDPEYLKSLSDTSEFLKTEQKKYNDALLPTPKTIETAEDIESTKDKPKHDIGAERKHKDLEAEHKQKVQVTNEFLKTEVEKHEDVKIIDTVAKKPLVSSSLGESQINKEDQPDVNKVPEDDLSKISKNMFEIKDVEHDSVKKSNESITITKESIPHGEKQVTLVKKITVVNPETMKYDPNIDDDLKIKIEEAKKAAQATDTDIPFCRENITIETKVIEREIPIAKEKEVVIEKETTIETKITPKEADVQYTPECLEPSSQKVNVHTKDFLLTEQLHYEDSPIVKNEQNISTEEIVHVKEEASQSKKSGLFGIFGKNKPDQDKGVQEEVKVKQEKPKLKGQTSDTETGMSEEKPKKDSKKSGSPFRMFEKHLVSEDKPTIDQKKAAESKDHVEEKSPKSPEKNKKTKKEKRKSGGFLSLFSKEHSKDEAKDSNPEYLKTLGDTSEFLTTEQKNYNDAVQSKKAKDVEPAESKEKPTHNKIITHDQEDLENEHKQKVQFTTDFLKKEVEKYEDVKIIDSLTEKPLISSSLSEGQIIKVKQQDIKKVLEDEVEIKEVEHKSLEKTTESITITKQSIPHGQKQSTVIKEITVGNTETMKDDANVDDLKLKIEDARNAFQFEDKPFTSENITIETKPIKREISLTIEKQVVVERETGGDNKIVPKTEGDVQVAQEFSEPSSQKVNLEAKDFLLTEQLQYEDSSVIENDKNVLPKQITHVKEEVSQSKKSGLFGLFGKSKPHHDEGIMEEAKAKQEKQSKSEPKEKIFGKTNSKEGQSNPEAVTKDEKAKKDRKKSDSPFRIFEKPHIYEEKTQDNELKIEESKQQVETKSPKSPEKHEKDKKPDKKKKGGFLSMFSKEHSKEAKESDPEYLKSLSDTSDFLKTEQNKYNDALPSQRIKIIQTAEDKEHEHDLTKESEQNDLEKEHKQKIQFSNEFLKTEVEKHEDVKIMDTVSEKPLILPSLSKGQVKESDINKLLECEMTKISKNTDQLQELENESFMNTNKTITLTEESIPHGEKQVTLTKEIITIDPETMENDPNIDEALKIKIKQARKDAALASDKSKPFTRETLTIETKIIEREIPITIEKEVVIEKDTTCETKIIPNSEESVVVQHIQEFLEPSEKINVETKDFILNEQLHYEDSPLVKNMQNIPTEEAKVHEKVEDSHKKSGLFGIFGKSKSHPVECVVEDVKVKPHKGEPKEKIFGKPKTETELKEDKQKKDHKKSGSPFRIFEKQHTSEDKQSVDELKIDESKERVEKKSPKPPNDKNIKQEKRKKGGFLSMFSKEHSKDEAKESDSEYLKHLSDTSEFLTTEQKNYNDAEKTTTIKVLESDKSEKYLIDTSIPAFQDKLIIETKIADQEQILPDMSPSQNISVTKQIIKKGDTLEKEITEKVEKVSKDVTSVVEKEIPITFKPEISTEVPPTIDQVRLISEEGKHQISELEKQLEQSRIKELQTEPDTLSKEQPSEISKKDEETKPKHEKKKSGGFLSFFTKESHADEPKPHEVSPEHIKNLNDTSDFLATELKNYEDAKPRLEAKTAESAELLDEVLKARKITTVTKEELPYGEKTITVTKEIMLIDPNVMKEVDGLDKDIVDKIEQARNEIRELEIRPSEPFVREYMNIETKIIDRETPVKPEKDINTTVVTSSVKESDTQPTVSKDVTDDTKDFLNNELISYEDGKLEPKQITNKEPEEKIKKSGVLGKFRKSQEKEPTPEPETKILKEPHQKIFGKPKVKEESLTETKKQKTKREKRRSGGFLSLFSKDSESLDEPKSSEPQQYQPEVVQMLQDTTNFLNIETTHYEDSKPQIITDLDDENDIPKTGLFSLFSKKDKDSPKVKKQKFKKQRKDKSLERGEGKLEITETITRKSLNADDEVPSAVEVSEGKYVTFQDVIDNGIVDVGKKLGTSQETAHERYRALEDDTMNIVQDLQQGVESVKTTTSGDIHKLELNINKKVDDANQTVDSEIQHFKEPIEAVEKKTEGFLSKFGRRSYSPKPEEIKGANVDVKIKTDGKKEKKVGFFNKIIGGKHKTKDTPSEISNIKITSTEAVNEIIEKAETEADRVLLSQENEEELPEVLPTTDTNFVEEILQSFDTKMEHVKEHDRHDEITKTKLDTQEHMTGEKTFLEQLDETFSETVKLSEELSKGTFQELYKDPLTDFLTNEKLHASKQIDNENSVIKEKESQFLASKSDSISEAKQHEILEKVKELQSVDTTMIVPTIAKTETEVSKSGSKDASKKSGGFLHKLGKKLTGKTDDIKKQQDKLTVETENLVGSVQKSSSEAAKSVKEISKDANNIIEYKTTEAISKLKENCTIQKPVQQSIDDTVNNLEISLESGALQLEEKLEPTFKKTEDTLEKKLAELNEATAELEKTIQKSTEMDHIKEKTDDVINKVTANVEETVKNIQDKMYEEVVNAKKISSEESKDVIIKVNETAREITSDVNQEVVDIKQNVEGIKEKTSNFLDSELFTEQANFYQIPRAVSDYGSNIRESVQVKESPNISEINIDLSNYTKNIEISDKPSVSAYVTSPTSARRAASQRFPKGERPELVEIKYTYSDDVSSEDSYIVTEPDEIREPKQRKPMFHIESEDDDSFLEGSPHKITQRTESVKSNILETLNESEVDDLLDSLKKDLVESTKETKKEVDSTIKRELERPEEHVKVSQTVDVNLIENRLRDLDIALDSLEQAEQHIDDHSKEKKLKRVERKFERMASDMLEKELDEAKRKDISTPEVETKRESEFQRLVSQLSIEEVSDFQREYSHLWDENTFSKSDGLDSKTPDSQADAQDLPKGDEKTTDLQQPTSTTSQAESEESQDTQSDQSKKVADQHQLSDEMKELLKELEKESKQ